MWKDGEDAWNASLRAGTVFARRTLYSNRCPRSCHAIPQASAAIRWRLPLPVRRRNSPSRCNRSRLSRTTRRPGKGSAENSGLSRGAASEMPRGRMGDPSQADHACQIVNATGLARGSLRWLLHETRARTNLMSRACPVDTYVACSQSVDPRDRSDAAGTITLHWAWPVVFDREFRQAKVAAIVSNHRASRWHGTSLPPPQSHGLLFRAGSPHSKWRCPLRGGRKTASPRTGPQEQAGISRVTANREVVFRSPLTARAGGRVPPRELSYGAAWPADWLDLPGSRFSAGGA